MYHQFMFTDGRKYARSVYKTANLYVSAAHIIVSRLESDPARDVADVAREVRDYLAAKRPGPYAGPHGEVKDALPGEEGWLEWSPAYESGIERFIDRFCAAVGLAVVVGDAAKRGDVATLLYYGVNDRQAKDLSRWAKDAAEYIMRIPGAVPDFLEEKVQGLLEGAKAAIGHPGLQRGGWYIWDGPGGAVMKWQHDSWQAAYPHYDPNRGMVRGYHNIYGGRGNIPWPPRETKHKQLAEQVT